MGRILDEDNFQQEMLHQGMPHNEYWPTHLTPGHTVSRVLAAMCGIGHRQKLLPHQQVDSYALHPHSMLVPLYEASLQQYCSLHIYILDSFYLCASLFPLAEFKISRGSTVGSTLSPMELHH